MLHPAATLCVHNRSTNFKSKNIRKHKSFEVDHQIWRQTLREHQKRQMDNMATWSFLPLFKLENLLLLNNKRRVARVLSQCWETSAARVPIMSLYALNGVEYLGPSILKDLLLQLNGTVPSSETGATKLPQGYDGFNCSLIKLWFFHKSRHKFIRKTRNLK